MIEPFGWRFVPFANFLLPFLANAVAQPPVVPEPHHFDWRRAGPMSSGQPYSSAWSCPEYSTRWRVVYPLFSALRSTNPPSSILSKSPASPAAEPPENDLLARFLY